MRREVISLRSVSLEYEGKTALRGLDWSVRSGESWAVIGANGAGKTSLMSVLNGYRWPTSGEVAVLGRRFGESDLRELRRHVGMVSAHLDGMISDDDLVGDVVASGKEGATKVWRKVPPGDARRARALLRGLGCGGFEGKRMREVSQGERQKVLIARAMMSDAELLTLDEPCEGLDLRAREDFLSGLGGLASRRSLAIVYVTHRTDEIPREFSHAMLLESGRIVASGPIGTTLTGPNLSRCMGVRVRVRKISGRYYAVV